MSLCSRPLSKELLQEMRQNSRQKNPQDSSDLELNHTCWDVRMHAGNETHQTHVSSCYVFRGSRSHSVWLTATKGLRQGLRALCRHGW